MDLLTTYKIFVIKTLKEKKYYWARNVFFMLFPILFFSIYTFSGITDVAIPGSETRAPPSRVVIDVSS